MLKELGTLLEINFGDLLKKLSLKFRVIERVVMLYKMFLFVQGGFCQNIFHINN